RLRLPACESGGDDDATRLEVDLAHALLVHRQREPRVELEHVVRDARRDSGHRPEAAAALLHHLQADELEDVVGALRRLRKLRAGNGQLSAPRSRPIEPDDEAAARALPRRDGRRLAAGEEARPRGEQPLVVARLLDDERAVEPMGPADAADPDEVVRLARGHRRVAHARRSGRTPTWRALVPDTWAARPGRAAGGWSRPRRLLNDLEDDAPVAVRAARADEGAQRAGDAPSPSDHPADVVAGDVEADHAHAVLVDLVHADGVRLVDQPPRQVLDQRGAQARSLALSRRETASEGCAPFASQSFTFASSSSITEGSVCGLYRPTISMNLPSRGERESATTTR